MLILGSIRGFASKEVRCPVSPNLSPLNFSIWMRKKLRTGSTRPHNSPTCLKQAISYV